MMIRFAAGIRGSSVVPVETRSKGRRRGEGVGIGLCCKSTKVAVVIAYPCNAAPTPDLLLLPAVLSRQGAGECCRYCRLLSSWMQLLLPHLYCCCPEPAAAVSAATIISQRGKGSGEVSLGGRGRGAVVQPTAANSSFSCYLGVKIEGNGGGE